MFNIGAGEGWLRPPFDPPKGPRSGGVRGQGFVPPGGARWPSCKDILRGPTHGTSEGVLDGPMHSR